MLWLGIRVGEVCGLTWNDIDFAKGQIHIRRIVERVKLENGKSKAVILDPKTKRSARPIPMSKELEQKLKSMSKKFDKNAYVITGVVGKFTEPTNYESLYKRKLKKLNVKYKKFHCLRHTFATKCVEVGMPIKELSVILGHANISTTLDTYVHPNLESSIKYLNQL